MAILLIICTSCPLKLFLHFFQSTEPLKAESNFPFQSTEPAKVPNPAKQVPESAAAMHPVMVLHQMKPGLQYNITQTTREGKPFFSVTSDIDGKEFTGEGEDTGKRLFVNKLVPCMS